ncbi:unnamed protein product [Arabidopsis halleri]
MLARLFFPGLRVPRSEYGQTSSGKTYTMSGITDCTLVDIYGYIDKHKEREFILKFSAMEIYNESVRDLLSTDTSPLKLLDDPEKGTVVEKLTGKLCETGIISRSFYLSAKLNGKLERQL